MDVEPAVTVQQVQEPQAQGAERTIVHEDGSLTIDILVRPPCQPDDTSEIVVCAEKQPEQDSDIAVDDAVASGDDLNVHLGGQVTLRPRLESAYLPGGAKSDRVMVDVIITF